MMKKDKFKSLQSKKRSTIFFKNISKKTLSRLINMRIINLDKVELTIDKNQ